ncbi:Rhythmically expressed gene 5 [Carabus blaptoides fortunei]
MAASLKNVFVFGCVIAMISASAIPMWEYLSKDEKMAYLYNMFANQVDDYCNTASMDDCNKQLLKYGLKNLHGMPEDHLDIMDPYQRGANTLIWESMMEGHEMMKKTTKNERSTTGNPEKDGYEFSESNYLGSASSHQETVLNLNGKLVQKVQPATKAPSKHFGPMIVKVHLDGRPVQEEKSIPADDDVHHYNILRTKVPALASLESPNTVPAFKSNSPYPYAVYSKPSRR